MKEKARLPGIPIKPELETDLHPVKFERRSPSAAFSAITSEYNIMIVIDNILADWSFIAITANACILSIQIYS